MWSFVEINDTLRITSAQWFPSQLDLAVHDKTPFRSEDFEGEVFSFHSKPSLRIYKLPPVRNFLVQDIWGKWLYRWHIHILSTEYDAITDMTSWTYRLHYIYTPQEMCMAHRMIDRVDETDYFLGT